MGKDYDTSTLYSFSKAACRPGMDGMFCPTVEVHSATINTVLYKVKIDTCSWSQRRASQHTRRVAHEHTIIGPTLSDDKISLTHRAFPLWICYRVHTDRLEGVPGEANIITYSTSTCTYFQFPLDHVCVSVCVKPAEKIFNNYIRDEELRRWNTRVNRKHFSKQGQHS